MKPLTKAIHDYLALRRSLGFKLRDAGLALVDFASFMEQQQAEHVVNGLINLSNTSNRFLKFLDSYVGFCI